jgi:hypothetical protein
MMVVEGIGIGIWPVSRKLNGQLLFFLINENGKSFASF